MMRNNIITNQDNGIVVNNSTTGDIVVNNHKEDFFDCHKLTSELEILLKNYQEKEKDDISGIKNIKNAVEYSKSNDKLGLKSTIRKYFTTYMKDLASNLSLQLLVSFIINSCK
jgi:hypothetical protein